MNRVTEHVVDDTEPAARTLDADERASLEDAGIEPDAVLEKECSYRTLLDAGVEEAVATALRRRLSLPWSFESDGDLDRRSSEIRGLGEEERAWIAASADEEWQAFEAARSRAEDESPPSDEEERPYPRPTPVTAVTAVGPDDAACLAEAGVVSAERLATIDATAVARALELDILHVRTWRHNARELVAD